MIINLVLHGLLIYFIMYCFPNPETEKTRHHVDRRISSVPTCSVYSTIIINYHFKTDRVFSRFLHLNEDSITTSVVFRHSAFKFLVKTYFPSIQLHRLVDITVTM